MKANLFAKNLLFIIITFLSLASCESNTENNNDKPAAAITDTLKKAASYQFSIPEGWTTEHIPFPIDFAPGIHYTGFEDLRFANRWEDILSDEHWCYSFVWWLDGKPVIDAETLQQNMTEYYAGLVKRNISERSIPAVKVVPTVAMIKKTETMNGDTETFTGTISMLDYIAQNPMVLNCLIHIKNCTTEKNTVVLFEISPRPFDHDLWKQLNKLNADFKCAN